MEGFKGENGSSLRERLSPWAGEVEDHTGDVLGSTCVGQIVRRPPMTPHLLVYLLVYVPALGRAQELRM